MKRVASAVLAVTVMITAVAACGGGTTIDEHPCPPGGTKLTYGNFGIHFFASYCNTCHSQPESMRQGAPPDYVFNTPEQIRAVKDRIFVRAAGPNDSMPPGPDDPPRTERDELADWLACGAP